MKISANFCVFNEEDYIHYSLEAIYPFVDKIVIAASDTSWRGNDFQIDRSLEIIRTFPDVDRKIVLKLGNWKSATQHRNFLLSTSRALGMDYFWVIDSDEIYEKETVDKLKRAIAEYPEVINFYCAWWTYWRSFYYRIEPPETSTFVIGKIVPSFKIVNVRQPSSGKTMRVDTFLHHYSYAKRPERVKQKLRNIIGPGGPPRAEWFQKFDNWPKNKDIGDLHPFWPGPWKKAIRITWDVPTVLKDHPWYKKEIIE